MTQTLPYCAYCKQVEVILIFLETELALVPSNSVSGTLWEGNNVRSAQEFVHKDFLCCIICISKKN